MTDTLSLRRLALGAARLATALALCLLLARPAAAHFIWIEPDPGDPDAVRTFFGEFPSVREAERLLSRVQGQTVFAVAGDQRRPLEQARAARHYRYEGVGDAPVVALQHVYGLFGDEPKRLLKYESRLLRGDGRPLTPEQLSELSKTSAGLDLNVALAPVAGAPGQYDVTVSRAGQPVESQLVTWKPGEGQEEEVATDAAGHARVTLPGGWTFLRAGYSDDQATTLDGQAAAGTSIYQTVLFQLPGEGEPTAVPVEADAAEALQRVREARATWPAGFPGFTARAKVVADEFESQGRITVTPEFTVEYDFPEGEIERVKAIIGGPFASLVGHRRPRPPVEEAAATWVDYRPHPLGRPLQLSDGMGSIYRVHDDVIGQVYREMGDQRLTIDTLAFQDTPAGNLSSLWVVSLRDADGSLRSTSTNRAEWRWQDDTFLPEVLQQVGDGPDGPEQWSLTLLGHRLLD